MRANEVKRKNCIKSFPYSCSTTFLFNSKGQFSFRHPRIALSLVLAGTDHQVSQVEMTKATRGFFLFFCKKVIKHLKRVSSCMQRDL